MSFSQTLHRQVTALDGLQGLTEHGKHFLEKYISPSAEVPWNGVPDVNGAPTTTIAIQQSLRIPSPASDSGKKWDLTVLYNPRGRLLGYWRSNTAEAIPTMRQSMILAEEPIFAAAHKDPVAFNQMAARYRIGYAGLTTHLDSSSITDEGTVSTVRAGCPWQIAPWGDGNSPNSNSGTAPFYQWKAPNYDYRGFNINRVDQQVISSRPGSVVRQAREGTYDALRNDGRFDWAGTDGAWYNTPTSTTTPDALAADLPHLHPTPDWDYLILRYENLHPYAAVILKMMVGYEFQTDLGSPLQSFMRLTPQDESAMRLVRALGGQFPGGWPADYNDWGTIWNAVKRTWNTLQPAIAGATALIPEVGPGLSALIGAMPKLSVNEQQQGARKARGRNRKKPAQQASQPARTQAAPTANGRQRKRGPQQRRRAQPPK